MAVSSFNLSVGGAAPDSATALAINEACKTLVETLVAEFAGCVIWSSYAGEAAWAVATDEDPAVYAQATEPPPEV